MASPSKKFKDGTGPEKEYIRVCDAFVRTIGGVISPLQKADESVRVLFKLQRELLKTLIQESAETAGLGLGQMEWVPMASDKQNDGNIFIEYLAELKDDAFEKFRKHLNTQLEERCNVKNILIDKLQTKSTILQPLITERDFDLYKLKLCHEMLSKAAGDAPEKMALAIQAENIKAQLEELNENRVKIGILSQNGKGKSFFLNLLFLLTADTEQEYEANNKEIKLPKDIEDNSTIEELKDENIKMLPQVIQKVLTKIRSNEQNKSNKENFKSFAKTFVHTLDFPDVEDNSFSGIKTYFTGSRTVFEPYILAQKEIEGSFDSTTKCVIHLRYGPLYQMKVEYISSEDLQFQLFEVKTFFKEETSDNNDGVCLERKEAAYKTLKARLALLTNLINDDDETVKNAAESWDSAEDIILSDDVMNYAGSTEMYVGNGMNATRDRLALKAVLKKLTTSQEGTEQERQQYRTKIAAVKKIVVYLPSKILIGSEILEMPGTDEDDPMAIDHITSALEKVDVVFLLSEYALKIGEKEVKEVLADSTFFLRMLMEPEPSNYKLMLLAYPEKQNNWQFGVNDQDKIKKLEKEEDRKRKEEIKVLGKIMKDKNLPGTLNEESIYTSYILPVLHTSIHAQKGACHEIIEQYKHFLKHTGVIKLMIELDTFATEKQKKSVLEIRDQLDKLLRIANGELDVENARTAVTLLQNRDLRSMREQNLACQNEKLLTDLRKRLEKTISNFTDCQISALLMRSIPKAEQRWKNNEEKITSTAVFNPSFHGKHPTYKVKIYDIIFEGLVEDAKRYFPVLMNELKEELDKYEREAIQLLTTELDILLQSRSEATQQFVERAVKQSLHDALTWYMGKKNLPFNEKTLERYFQQSQKMSLRNKILKPEVKTKDISEAKKIMTDGIKKTIEDVKVEFEDRLFSTLHKKRFKSLCGKLKDKKGNFRMWQILMGKIRSISRNTDIQPQVDNIKKAIKLMSINLRDIPE